MERKLIKINADDVNLSIVENNILMQTNGDTDIVFEQDAIDIMFQNYLKLITPGVEDKCEGCTNSQCGCE